MFALSMSDNVLYEYLTLSISRSC